MPLRLTSTFRYALRLGAAIVFAALAMPAVAAVLTVSPASGGPGATVKVVASGLSPSTSYTLEFVGNPATNIATLASNATGRISVSQVLPTLPVGSGKMRLKTISQIGGGGSVVGYTAFTALGGVSFTPQGTTFHAGQSIRFQVAGLTPGTVTVLYENGAVAGPVTVSGSNYSGRFVIPTDRPVPLPANARVRVVNKVGKVVVNQLDTTMRVLPRLASPFNIGITQPPANTPRPGQRMQVSGSVAVGANESPPNDLSLWYFGNNGEVFPLGSTQVVEAGGSNSYAMEARAPGTLAMTAGQSAQGRARLVGRGTNTLGQPTVLQQGAINDSVSLLPTERWRITVRVRKPNGDPIPGAIVQIEGAPVIEPGSGDDGGGALGGARRIGTLNDFLVSSSAPNQLALPLATDAQGCPITLSRKVADNNGNVTFEFDDQALGLNFSFQGEATAGGSINLDAVPFEVRLAIDASAQSHGFQFTEGPNAFDFLPHIYKVGFYGAGNADPVDDNIVLTDWYQNVEVANSPSRTLTYTLSLPPITPKVALFDVAIKPWVAVAIGDGQNSGSQSWSSIRQVFGPVNRLPTTQPYASWVNIIAGEEYPTEITVRTDPAVSGVIQPGNAKLYLDMNRNGTAEFIGNFSTSALDLNCTIDGLDKSLTWRATLPTNLKTSAPGRIKGYVQFIGQPNTGQATKRIGVDIVDTDLSWLNDPKFGEQELYYRKGGQQLGWEAVENLPDTAVQLPTNPGYQIGRLRNETNNQRLIGSGIDMAGNRQSYAFVDGTHMAAGRDGDPTQIDAAEGVTYGPEPTTLIDQSIPLFYYTWGVPVLAGVEIGADFSLLAEISMLSRYDTQPNGNPRLTLVTEPSIDMGLNFYIDLDILFDLVDGEVDLGATFGVDMPVRVVNGVNQPVQPDFDAALVLSWYFDIMCLPVWIDPICNAIPTFDDCERLLPTNDNRPCPEVFDRPETLAVAGGQVERGVRPLQSALAYSRSGAGLMATTRADPTLQNPPRLIVRPIDGGDFGRLPDETTLSTAPGIRSVAIEYYDDERAVAVWAENADTYAVLSTRTAVQRLARQRLMYSLWDGENWSAKAQLTPVSGGEGGVDLAACLRREDADCPADGEVLAVWTRDMAGDLLQHRTRVYSSRFTPARGWTTPQPVDSSASALLDSAPSAAYVDAVPVAAFVRSTNGVFADTAARRVAYRFLQSGTSVQVPDALPGGVAWPSIVGLPAGGFAIAHTHGEPGRAFVSNRHRAALAYADGCSAGSCAVVAQAVTDGSGRPVYGERPSALLDNDGNLSVVMRGTGFGPDAQGASEPRAGDPLGMVGHTGELIAFATSRGQSVIQPQALSVDGASHFAPAAAFDPELNQVVATSTRSTPIPPGLRNKMARAGVEAPPARAHAVLGEDGLAMYAAEQGVDFAIEEISTNATSLVGGSTVQVTVKLRNIGSAYTAVQPAWQMVLSLDAPRDAGGTTYGGRFVPSLAPGAQATLVSNITVPAGFSPDQSHRLYAQVYRAGNPVEDVNSANDVMHKDFGGMPMPFALNASAVPGVPLVQLTWDPIDDPTDLIAGFRIWCHDGDGEWRHLGSSFNTGFIDLAPPIGVERHYRVTSYSRNAIESPPSSEAVATATLDDGLFANGFE